MLRHSLHSVRPSHCPKCRNEQRKRPTLDVYTLLYITIPRDTCRFVWFDISLEVAKFYRVKVKALSKRLFSVCHPTTSDGLYSTSSAWNSAKISIIFETTKKSGRKFHLNVMKYLPECIKCATDCTDWYRFLEEQVGSNTASQQHLFFRFHSWFRLEAGG